MVEYEVSEKQGGRVTLHVRGRIVADHVPDEEAFKRSLETHYVDDGVKEIRVDLSDLEEISLEGIAVLIALWKESAARGKRFVGQGGRGQVREKLQITGTLRPLESPPHLMGRTACPCCGMGLTEPPAEGSADLTDERPGDRWCDFCHWVILQELEDPDFAPMECPTHGPLHRSRYSTI